MQYYKITDLIKNEDKMEANMYNLLVWGQQIDEYKEMFDLTPRDLDGKILEYGGGPSALNAQLTQDKKKCISFDPLFALDHKTLKQKATAEFSTMVEKLTQEKDQIKVNLEDLIQKRRSGMKTFFDDYDLGKQDKRYLSINDTNIPFPKFSFDLALSSNHLFNPNQDKGTQLKIIKELARASKEVRIFPIIDETGHPLPLLGPILRNLQQENYHIEVKTVINELQPKGNAMLRVWTQRFI